MEYYVSLALSLLFFLSFRMQEYIDSSSPSESSKYFDIP